MPGLFLVNAFDASRSLGPRFDQATPEGVEDFFVTEYLARRGGGFSHDPAIFVTGDLFRGRINTPQAEQYCLSNGAPAGREQNSAIAKLVGPYAEQHISVVHKIGFLAIAVGRYKGRTIYLGLKTPYVRVEGDDPYLVVPGYRKTYLPSDEQVGFPIALAHHWIAKDDLSGIDTEYLYAGPGARGEDRVFRAVVASSRSLLTADAIDDLLQVYVAGVVRVLDRGLGRSNAKLAGYRAVDPGQSKLF